MSTDLISFAVYIRAFNFIAGIYKHMTHFSKEYAVSLVIPCGERYNYVGRPCLPRVVFG